MKKIDKNILLIIALSCCIAGCKYSSNESFERLDGKSISFDSIATQVNQLVDTANVTGLAICLFDHNEVAYQETFGWRNRTKELPLTDSTNIYGASLSKAVFAYIAVSLVHEGVIQLDTPLEEYLGRPLPEVPFEKEWRGFANLKNDPRHEKLTARMCLSHTTGFPNWRWISREGNFDREGKIQIYTDPGTEYFYSGEGIRLLQIVIEKVTGKDLEKLARDLVFDPLGMESTSYIWQEKFRENFSVGHRADEVILDKNFAEEPGAAGSLETTPDDYARFLSHILKLSAENSPITNLMFEPNIRIKSKQQFGPGALEKSNDNDDIQLSYALGWGWLKTPYGYGVFKEGHSEGFQHYTILFPESGKGIMLLSNSDNAESIYKELLEKLMGDVYTPWFWELYFPYDAQSNEGNEI